MSKRIVVPLSLNEEDVVFLKNLERLTFFDNRSMIVRMILQDVKAHPERLEKIFSCPGLTKQLEDKESEN